VTTDIVRYTLEGTTAIITMDDGKANALSYPLIDGLTEALARAEREAAAIVLAGRPEKFCAGFDLKVMMSGPDATRKLMRHGGDLLVKLYGTPLPLVIACTGHAIAGGALLVLTGDVRIGAAGAFRIGFNEVSIGLPVPMLAQEFARDRLAPAALQRALLGAQIYTPDEAIAAGYLDAVVPADDLLARATGEAARLGAFSRSAYRATKERLRGATIARITSSFDDDMARLLSPS
jgi:enoyl-CoA hydratase